MRAMRASIALSAVASAISGANAYFDGYLNVSSAVEPLQIRLAYAKNFDMMGEALRIFLLMPYTADTFHPSVMEHFHKTAKAHSTIRLG